MAESEIVQKSVLPLTANDITVQLQAAGVENGQTVLVHSSLSKLGWVCGGAVTVIEALLAVLGDTGTLVMPTHSSDNSDPAQWQAPPVPVKWWPAIRATMPPFDARKTPTRGMGAIPEAFRSWPGAMRSYHPTASFTAHGPLAYQIVSEHDLEDGFGERSPLARLYELDALVLLLGVGHDNNTSIHLAESRARYAGKRFIDDGAAVLRNGMREWVAYRHLDWDSDDFAQIGQAYESAAGLEVQRVGLAPVRLMRQRPLVDFAVAWLEVNR